MAIVNFILYRTSIFVRAGLKGIRSKVRQHLELLAPRGVGTLFTSSSVTLWFTCTVVVFFQAKQYLSAVLYSFTCTPGVKPILLLQPLRVL